MPVDDESKDVVPEQGKLMGLVQEKQNLETKKILVFRTFKLLNFTCGGKTAAITPLLIDTRATFMRHVNIFGFFFHAFVAVDG